MYRIVISILVAVGCTSMPHPSTEPDAGAVLADGSVDSPDTITSCTTTIADPTGVHEVPACVVVPSGVMPRAGWPVVFAWHAVGDNYTAALSRVGLNRIADTSSGPGWAIVVAPEGLLDAHGARYFNAGDECCDDYDADPDDLGFASYLLTTVEATYTVDITQVSGVGISNGGFMAASWACSDPRVANVVEASGAITPPCANPIVIRHVHGREDRTIYFSDNDPRCPGGPPCHFEGLSTLTPYPSADDPTAFGCTGWTATGVTKDFNASVAGAESTEYQATGCPVGTEVDFWDQANTAHIPSWTAAWQLDATVGTFAWMHAHHK